MSLIKKAKPSAAKKPAKAPVLPKKAKPEAPAAPATPKPKPADAPSGVVAKRKRNSNPLFAEITLGKLTELMGGDKDAKVTASRNFLLAQSTTAARAKAAADLGI